MNFPKQIVIWLVIIVLLGLAGPCFGNHSSEETLTTEKLGEIFRQLITEDSPFSAEDLVITNFSCRPNQIELPPGNIEFLTDIGNMTGRLGLRSFVLKIVVDGKQQARVKMAGNLLLFGNVISAAKVLKRDKLLTHEDLLITRKNITMLGADLSKDPSLVVGKQLKTTLRPGAIVYDSFLKSPQIIKRGDMVQIVAENPRIHVSVRGQARSSGARGEMIKVKNMMSRKQIYARVINHNEVNVEF
jgi:flagella basal body P-ring formation protein FlgA